jgi:mitochondrial enoyl-[acyl-carrier protein] reductase / trans-2-enoyl-CoA reductase
MLLIKRNMSCLASVLRYAEYGEPGKVLKVCAETLEAPQNDNLLVKILLAPINPADINTIQGKLIKHHKRQNFNDPFNF